LALRALLVQPVRLVPREQLAQQELPLQYRAQLAHPARLAVLLAQLAHLAAQEQ
jgi:hypothetical protein